MEWIDWQKSSIRNARACFDKLEIPSVAEAVLIHMFYGWGVQAISGFKFYPP